MTEFEKIMEAVHIETAENNIREKHNETCKTKDIMAYRSNAFIKMIKYTQELLNDYA